jgi:hypothetical protein
MMPQPSQKMLARSSWAATLVASSLALTTCGSADPSESTIGETAASEDSSTTDPSEGTTSAETTSEDQTSEPSTSGTTGAPAQPTPGDDIKLRVFDGAHVYFGEQNMRQIDVEVSFPAAELAYESVTLDLVLSCPNGKCDWWDRKGYLGIVNNPGAEDESITELARFITPYRVGATWSFDLTSLRPLLAGDQTLRVFIDTWVGPGHQNGDGWIVDAQFDLRGGIPARLPIAVIPVWDRFTVEVGDPDKPIDVSVPARVVAIPAEASALELHAIITGHGQGNLNNCAEFCAKVHGFMIGGESFTNNIWRDDCGQTPVQGQQGTWMNPRAGWCPGAEVIPWIEDVSAALTPGEEATFVYGTEPYENTCRPDAPVCTGCALQTGCDYDGGNHTPPIYDISALLVVYQ